MASVLDVRDLSVRLPAGSDRQYAVKQLNLTVEPGEILCVVGESGSGKSVTAHTIMGLLPRDQHMPVTGKICLNGENLLEATPERRRELRGVGMAMIFQEPMTALNPVFPVGRQITEMLTTHTPLSTRECRRQAVELMSAVQLPEPELLYRAYPHQLSGGQRQRVMIAMALALKPPLLIADEPTTALDVTTQAQILDLIRALQAQQGTGVMFITHDFGVVADIADRVVVMQHGQVVETGITREVLSAPRHGYTKMLVSAVPSLTPRHRTTNHQSPVALSTQALHKTYASTGWLRRGRRVHAARDVNLEVRRGQTLGIVGESGSGKSTVARCIVRLIDPTRGKIFLGDDEIGNLSPTLLRQHRRRIQIIFQDPYRSLNPRRTVGSAIAEGPMNFGLSRQSAWGRAQELLRVVGLDTSAAERFPSQFSGGQRQRICIARALAMKPEVLIADEAVSALDVSVQAQVLALLDEVRERYHLAMLFITHDLRVAAQICDHVAVMYQGEVVEYGPVQDIFSTPRHDYTQKLFAAAPGRYREPGRFPSTENR